MIRVYYDPILGARGFEFINPDMLDNVNPRILYKEQMVSKKPTLRSRFNKIKALKCNLRELREEI